MGFLPGSDSKSSTMASRLTRYFRYDNNNDNNNNNNEILIKREPLVYTRARRAVQKNGWDSTTAITSSSMDSIPADTTYITHRHTDTQTDTHTHKHTHTHAHTQTPQQVKWRNSHKKSWREYRYPLPHYFCRAELWNSQWKYALPVRNDTTFMFLCKWTFQQHLHPWSLPNMFFNAVLNKVI